MKAPENMSDADVANLLARGLRDHEAGRYDQAMASYAKLLRARPDHVDANQLSGLIAKKRGDFDTAIARMSHALAYRPSDAEVTYNLGNTYWERGELHDAIACYDKAVSLKPGHENAWVNRGRTLQHLGRETEAGESFRQATKIRPTSGKAWENLILTRSKVSAGDPDLNNMRAALDNIAPDGADARCLHFALGRALASHGATDRAFGHYVAGNRIAYMDAQYNVQNDEHLFDLIKRAFPTDPSDAGEACGAASSQPIFILGMPRSGTTLVEQILTSHSAVAPGGERRDLTEVLKRVRLNDSPQTAFPDWVPHLNAADWKSIGEAYLARLPAQAEGILHLTDKMPANFRMIGAIRHALPHARIVHVKRATADTCLSCFFQNFTNGNAFAFDQQALGRYYRAYEDLMAHWRRVLPDHGWLEVSYEDLVAQPEREVARLLRFCDLSWEPACLSFHETQRPVMTASMSQVRQPLYRHSVDRWRAYKPFLGPLFRALGPLAPSG